MKSPNKTKLTNIGQVLEVTVCIGFVMILRNAVIMTKAVTHIYMVLVICAAVAMNMTNIIVLALS
jgi:hypothetical protein